MNEKRKWIWTDIKPVLTIIILAVCAILLFFGIKEPDIQLADQQIQIQGMYGMKIDFADVKNLTLIEKSMREIGIGRRTNGFGGIGSTLKGNFESASLGKHKLFVNADSSPTLFIERNSDVDLYISFNDSQKTRDLFAALREIQ
ncbi:hypothetical protein [Clostridium sp. D33t1_170424_F3]|uniref:hypothetical protein n=1 Tax=Clostridium sp. D33t1_170424_F3 TaxID=2787099 RepID=UPI0018ABB910|nr:hypothetical protein [Clostridium sp. D33t1_170424_F3]